MSYWYRWFWVWAAGLGVMLVSACAPAAVVDGAAATAVPIREAPVVAKELPETAVSPSPTPTQPPPPTLTPLPTMMATAVPTLLPPPLENPPNETFAQTAAAFGGEFVPLTAENSGVWQYPADTFVHPLAFSIWEGRGYMVDSGRVLALDLGRPVMPELLLQGGDEVEGVRVLEPLDLAAAADGLLVLDRAGDVYRYDWDSGVWSLDWYDRPIGDTSSHYYVAVAAEGNGRYLLETSYKYTMRYEDGEQQSLWTLPEARAVDVSAAGERVYVLMQEMANTDGGLALYQNTGKVGAFRPASILSRPRQVAAGETAVYVLDEGGERLLAFTPEYGKLSALYQLPPTDPAGAFALDPDAGNLLFAGENRLYFLDQPDRLAVISALPMLTGVQVNDSDFLASISGFAPPIGWNITTRDLQMPGAPRHYRLGVHRGADFYWQNGSPEYATADGVVIRAMHDYAPPFPADFYHWREETQRLGYTSEEALDFYGGRQVWIEHEDGLVSRYLHLGGIDTAVQEGQPVTQGQLIGYVGNSGSPASLEGAEVDAHLHFELWYGDHYIGQFLRPVETRDWINRILHGSSR